jgi:hypothetical protein
VRPALLHLEGRTLPSTLTVANLHDHGAGSLRAALAQARGGDTVAFDRSLGGAITLTSGELQVGPGVAVKGPGAGRLSVSANHASRVLEVLPGAGVALSGLTITGGLASAQGPDALAVRGGGIYVDQGASLTLTDSAVTGNTASTSTAVGLGGGVYNAGTLTLEGDTVANNTANAGPGTSDGSDYGATGYGGGIYNAGKLALVGGTVANNTANAGVGTASKPNYVDAGAGSGPAGPDSSAAGRGITALNLSVLTLSSTVDVAGLFVAPGGTLTGTGTINGDVTNAGTVRPGSATAPGVLAINGAYTQTAAGTLAVRIGGLAAGDQYDRLVVNGIATLDGTLDVTLVNGFMPHSGDPFRVLCFTGGQGFFAHTTGNADQFAFDYQTGLTLVAV